MKHFKFIVLSLAVALVAMACTHENATNPPVEPVFGQIGSGAKHYEITSDTTFAKGTYELKGWVYIPDGVTVTIEPGTIIKGDISTMASLIVEPGGKLYARGTKEEPIVFTSNQPIGQRRPGDWGGLILCGKAPNNKGIMTIEGGPRTSHGGNDPNDCSGALEYVRVEFAGYPFQADQEINGITFGSVGRGTKISHLQVSYCNDDSYEWFGGTVDCKYLVAYHGWDDEFDTDNGFQGRLQYLLSVRHPRIADTSVSSGFESDNNSDGNDDLPMTSPVFANVTFVGPIAQGKNDTDLFIWNSWENNSNNSNYINAGDYKIINPENNAKLGVFSSAMHVRRNSRLQCYNSVAVGFPIGLLLDIDKKTETNNSRLYAQQNKTIANNFFGGCGILGTDVYKQMKDSLSENGKLPFTAGAPSYSTQYAKENNTCVENGTPADYLIQPNSLLGGVKGSNFAPIAGGEISRMSVKSMASFNVTDNFFDNVDYVGAFKSDSEADDWTAGWCNFDPQNTEY